MRISLCLALVTSIVVSVGAGCSTSEEQKPTMDGGTGGPDQSTAPPTWAWAFSVGGVSGADLASSFAVDSEGNSYITGTFVGEVAFGSITLKIGDCSPSIPPPPCDLETGMFVAKLDASGTFLWATVAAGVEDQDGNVFPPEARGIAVDDAGNSYVTGSLSGPASFGSVTLTPQENTSPLFVAKLDASGKFLWATATTGSGGLAVRGPGIAVDGAGNSYVTGGLAGSLSFGSTTLDSDAAGSYAPFVAKLDASGAFVWANAAKISGTPANPAYTAGRSIAVDDAGNCTITGSFDGTATFGTTTLVSKGSGNDPGYSIGDAFVAKLDKGGTFLWATSAGGPGNELGNGIAVDGAGNSYITGIFQDGAGFDATLLKAKAPDSWDAFVAKLDPSGTFLWARSAGGRVGNGSGIEVDSSGNSTVTGDFVGAVTFGSKSQSLTGMTSDFPAAFVVRLDSSGTPIWMIAADGHVEPVGVGIDSQGNSVVAGGFDTTATFGAISLKTQTRSIFVAKVK